MTDDKSIIKIDNLNIPDHSKVGWVFLEKISSAIGELHKPSQIKNVAKAEAEAEVIKAEAEAQAELIREEAQVKISDLRVKRALNRFIAEEAKKQENIEKTTQKALNQLNQSSKPQDMDDDWITNFFDKCRIISDEEMQVLWAKILAGEANSPGSYSKRTVNLLGSLDKKDAELLTTLCNFTWISGESYPLILDANAPIYIQNGINFVMLTHLDSIGLIRFDPVGGFMLKRTPTLPLIGMYYNKTPIAISSENNIPIEVGKVMFTHTGQELSRICSTKPIDGLFKYVFDYWASKGLILSLPSNPKH